MDYNPRISKTRNSLNRFPIPSRAPVRWSMEGLVLNSVADSHRVVCSIDAEYRRKCAIFLWSLSMGGDRFEWFHDGCDSLCLVFYPIRQPPAWGWGIIFYAFIWDSPLEERWIMCIRIKNRTSWTSNGPGWNIICHGIFRGQSISIKPKQCLYIYGLWAWPRTATKRWNADVL